MGDAAVNFAPGTILFMVFEYIYIALILMCFVLYVLLSTILIQIHGKSSSRFEIRIHRDSIVFRAVDGLHAFLLGVVDN
jgi:hypothetical protein